MLSETERDGAGSPGGMDVKVICDLILAMNMAASKLITYPEGHPFVIESFEKVENILRGIFESQSQLTLKIAQNAILLGSSTLDPQNPILQRFARTLFAHGIIALILQKGLVSQELMDFDSIISQKRNDVNRQGGINTLLSKAGIRHIQTRLIDYALFQKQESLDDGEENKENLDTSLFWENFVKGFFEETLDPHGSRDESSYDIGPETFAMMLNERHLCDETNAQRGPCFSFKTGMQTLNIIQLADNEELSKKVIKFIKSLNNDLRQSFMEAFFNSLPDDSEVVRNILGGFPDEIILEALDKHTSQGLYIPPNILRVSQKLAKASKNMDVEAADQLFDGYSKEELVDKFKIIFKEDEADQFIPLDYQKILQDAIGMQDISLPELSEVPQLEKTLTDHSINASLTAIIVEMITAYDDGAALPDVIIQSLKERCRLLIQDGDFQAVCKILETVGTREFCLPNDQEAPPRNITEVISDRDFTYEVLKATAESGKDRHFYITKLILLVGPAFIEPLLDRLAEEDNKALRLYYLNLFKRLGVSVKDRVIRRLSDRRWYFVRNLLIILRYLDDPSVLDSVRGLFDHSHIRVRQELLHTLLALGDPQAGEMLMHELESTDTDRCLKAIMLAGMTSNREVIQKLVGFLKKRGLDKSSFEIKKASVQALANIGDPSIFPVLINILNSFSLFSRRNSHLLKLEIVESLGRYPAEEAIPILQRISRGRPLVLANRALQVIKTMKVD
jgi:hypothetical protein